MDPMTPALRKGDRVFSALDVPNLLENSDIVAGNTYECGPRLRLIPNPKGDYVALVTHRGENAAPRLERLPIGTRVRRGAGWSPKEYGYPEDCGDIGTVVVIDDTPCIPYRVRWGGRSAWWHSRACLEVVSLPEAEPAVPANYFDDAEDPCPKDAILVNHNTHGPLYDCWWDANGNHFGSNPTVRDFSAWSFVRGKHYDVTTGKESPRGWLCVRDYTGPNYVAPAPAWKRPAYEGTGSCVVPEGVPVESLMPDDAVMAFDSECYPTWQTPTTWVGLSVFGRLLEWRPARSKPTKREVPRQGDWYGLRDWSPAAEFGPYNGNKTDAMGLRGSPDYVGWRPLPSGVAALQDYTPPEVLRRRARTVKHVVPTDLDIPGDPF